MMGFVSSFAGGATLAVRARSALAGRAVAVSPSASARVARWTMVKSKAMPFMEAPPALDGTMAGDVGFDPLNFTSVFDIKWMREAELKHCRITMLACLGFLVQEAFTLPASYFPNGTIAVDAHDYFVKTGGMQQLLLWFCFAEVFSLLATNYTMSGGDRAPGDFAFDPLKFSNTPAKRARMELSEIKNGRLAMIAIGGFIHQEWYSHKPVLDLLAHPAPILNISM
ncbi:hypothetical protein MMPV_001387 [Pyropia vietnamensis]